MRAFLGRMAWVFFFFGLAVRAASLPLAVREPLISWVAGTDQAEVDWTAIDQQLSEVLAAQGIHGPWKVELVFDGQSRLTIPAGHTTWRLPLVVGEQHDVVAEFFTQQGKLVHRSDPGLLEVHTAQTIRRESFDGIPLLSIHLPERQAAAYGLDNNLARTAVDIGREKVSWVLRKGADPRLRAVPAHLLDVTVDFGSLGRPRAITVQDMQHGTVLHPSPSNFFIKVDAAFNGDSFFWDDMFVSLETAWHEPDLVDSTLDFWYAIQDEYGSGVIPREVRKVNRLSFNAPQTFSFGKERENGAYTNPNLSGWVEWQLYALRAPRLAARRLPVAIRSIEHYLDWLRTKRAVAGVPFGLWQDNLGSGMDNLPRGGGDDNPEANRHSVWIDLMAQQVAMFRDVARMRAALGQWKESAREEAQAEQIEGYLNAFHWSDDSGFYFDRIPGDTSHLRLDETTPTIAGFWPLWSGSAPRNRVDSVIQHQLVSGRFGSAFPLPALSESHPLYSDQGHYWLGGRWPSTATMAIQALANSGRPDVALNLTRGFLRGMSQVSQDYAETHGRGTVFEFYGVERHADGTMLARPGMEPGHLTRADFAGWGAVPPVYNNLRHWVGLRPIPGFAGPFGEGKQWLDELAHSSVFAHTNFLGFNSFLKLPRQRILAERGYLEWNLLFDPGSGTSDPMEIDNVVYRGTRVAKLSVRSLSPDLLRVSVRSERPFPLQLNRLFDRDRTLSEPLSTSAIEEVGGNPSTDQSVDFPLATAQSPEVG